MIKLLLLLSIPVLIAIIIIIRKLMRKSRHQQFMRAPFPQGWEDILEKVFPLYNRLPENLQAELKGKVQIFLDEKNFEGAVGFEISDEIQVSIAAQACFIILNRDVDVYPGLISIVVYPATYKHKGMDIAGVINDGEKSIAGESWGTDLIVLAWNQVVAGAGDINDGQNVVFHEFAHQLDAMDGDTDGIPVLDKGSSYESWIEVCGDEFAALVDELKTRKKLVMDRYGATNPAEFFAVATESFFERPVDMKKKHPKLYEQMKKYYKQNPVDYFDERGR
jgi:MtfA peptidase